MKRLLILPVLLIALTGCSALGQVFGTFTNPATPQRLAEAENTYGILVRSAVAYRNGCARAPSTACRNVVRIIQKADNYTYGQILVARKLVAAGDLNAATAISAAQDAIAAYKSAQAANGVP